MIAVTAFKKISEISSSTWLFRYNKMREHARWIETLDPCSQHDGGRAAMEALLYVYNGLAEWSYADPAEAAVLQARVRRPELIDLLHGQRAQGTLMCYAGEGQSYALRGRVDGYRQACEHRSAIKLLIDDFEEVIIDQFTQEELEDLDEELRDAADDATPVHRRQIPSWAPRSHWWWWKPDHIDMSMSEYGNRIYAGDLEDGASAFAEVLRCGDQECWCYTAPA
ncbi:hypothetical protein AGRA3207_007446 [Actinomadura graeca]|uniref:Uncharacterized protein n=1 Tax=Actinomadura graeca TaxID=2750812 RepID=A0ABX8R483_9ACTN|nr:hypothetical protein [Actinomadura graeca]QXJ25881.1 hypothetical protein AGRA3207_007446 [Actinomadura graeca]